MPDTYQSIVIKAPVGEVWKRVRNFHDMTWAPKVINECTDNGDTPGTGVGAKRILNGMFHETLREHNDDEHRMRYSIDDGPSPVSKGDVSRYMGELHLIPVTSDDSTFVEWSSSWESDSQEAVEFCHGIYTALLNELAASFQA